MKMKKAQLEYVTRAVVRRCSREWMVITTSTAEELVRTVVEAIAESSIEAKERAELARLKAKYEHDDEARAT